MEGQARAGHDPGGGLRLEWPDFRQPIPDRQGDDGDQLERPSLLRASAGKSRRFRSGKGPPKGQGESRRDNSVWRIARKPAPMKNLATKQGLRCAIYTRVSTDQGLEQDFNPLDAQREASEAYIPTARFAPKQAAEQIGIKGVNFGRRSPALGGHFSAPKHTGLCHPSFDLLSRRQNDGQSLGVNGRSDRVRFGR